jgi:hypothetical protein
MKGPQSVCTSNILGRLNVDGAEVKKSYVI